VGGTEGVARVVGVCCGGGEEEEGEAPPTEEELAAARARGRLRALERARERVAREWEQALGG